MAGEQTDGGALGSVQAWLSRAAAAVTGSRVHVPDYDPGRHGRLVGPPALGDREEVERYWLNAPFAYASLTYDDETDEHRYEVVEPSLDDVEIDLLARLFRDIRDPLLYREDVAEDSGEALREELRQRLEEYGVDVPTESFYRLYYYLYRSFLGYGKLDPIMGDPGVEDVSCDGPDLPVFVYHEDYTDVETNVAFDPDELDDFVIHLAQRSGRHVSVSDPVVSTTLPDGSRIELALGEEVTPRGSAFTIRKYADEPFTPIDLLEYGTYDVSMLAFLWLAIENNKSLIFAGGTAAGKTTSMNAVSMFVPRKSKVISIEDTREITLPHDNWIQSVTREGFEGGRGEIGMYELLQAALRQRPEYLLVGEIRTEQDVALAFFQAMATGHTAYTTVHSESVRGVINRLENEPLGVPTQMLKELDIISIQRQVMLGDERVRRNDSITELLARGDAEDISVNDVFEWDPRTDSYNEAFESEVLQEIADDRGWSARRLDREFERRKEVLRHLIRNDVTWYEDVARTIHAFIDDQERVLEALRADDRSPSELEVG